jgi:hypothetical protein
MDRYCRTVQMPSWRFATAKGKLPLIHALLLLLSSLSLSLKEFNSCMRLFFLLHNHLMFHKFACNILGASGSKSRTLYCVRVMHWTVQWSRVHCMWQVRIFHFALGMKCFGFPNWIHRNREENLWIWLRHKLNFRVCLNGHYFPLKDKTVEIVLRNVMRDLVSGNGS